MGKPRLIIICRHAQSEGNKNREIHQSTPDHRVPLTTEGWQQAHEAGRKLRRLLRPTDTVHFFVSPYLRTRQTAEGMLSELTSDDPSPSPFPRHTIKVYEEPRLREQDFGNFQPGAAEMSRMWQERANYGHFFYRIPNGESAADAYDRISGFNDSLWRRFEEPDFASVCILVTHGLMSRVFLMKWYHFSVEYFEDLRNINHCEFIVMKKDPNSGKYILQNHLRTWTEYRRERLSLGSISQPEPPTIPMRRKWGGCPEGCSHDQHNHTPTPGLTPRKPPIRRNTADLFKDEDDPIMRTPPGVASGSPLATARSDSAATIRRDKDAPDTPLDKMDKKDAIIAEQESTDAVNGPSTNRLSFSKYSLSQSQLQRPSLLSLGGRDGGGSQSGAASVTSNSDPEDVGDVGDVGDDEKQGEEEEQEEDVDPLTITRKYVQVPWPTNRASSPAVQSHSLARALKGEPSTSVEDAGGPAGAGRALADALGDQSEDEMTEVEIDEEKEREESEMRKIMEEEKRERSVDESVY